MKRDIISIRISNEKRILYQDLSKRYNITMSGLMRLALDEFLQKPQSKKILEKHRTEIETEEKLTELREKNKKDNYQLFLIDNTQRTIFKITFSLYIQTGEINVKAVIRIIENAEKIYDKFPDDIKEVIKEEIEHLIKLKEEKYLQKWLYEKSPAMAYAKRLLK